MGSGLDLNLETVCCCVAVGELDEGGTMNSRWRSGW